MARGTPPAPARVILYWIPLGAGGAATVRVSGRIYEAIQALLKRRRPLDLYHTALEIQLGASRYIIENAWPSPDADTQSRGVVVEGPVWSAWLGRFRTFRYEVRCWQDGTIPDAAEAVTTKMVSTSTEAAQRLLDLAVAVPTHTWGRRVSESEEMWNSNSVISYLLTIAGFPAETYAPPTGGQAPGWRTGIVLGQAFRMPERGPRSLPKPSNNGHDLHRAPVGSSHNETRSEEAEHR